MVSEFWKSDEDIVKATRIGIFCLLMYSLTYLLSNACFDLKIAPIYDSCMGSSDFSPRYISVMFSIVLFVTIRYDIALLLKIRKWKRQIQPSENMLKMSMENGHILNEPGMRSTFVNLVFMAISLLAYNLLSSVTLEQGLYNKVLFTFLLATTLRCPAIVFWTLNINEANARIDREKNRQVEIEEAKIRMAEIRAKRNFQSIPNSQQMDGGRNLEEPEPLDKTEIVDIEVSDDERNVFEMSKLDKGLSNIAKGVSIGPHCYIAKDGGVPILVQQYNPKSTKHVSFLGRQNSFPGETVKVWYGQYGPNEEE